VVMNADLRIVEDDLFAFGLHYFTGGKEHNIVMRQRAIDRGLKLSEYGLTGPGKSVKAKEEADVFKALGCDYIPPEMRENTGEIEAAENHTLPQIIQPGDIQGTFHCHTTASDGRNTLEEMAEAARKFGLKYLGIGDHSQSLTIANGLSPGRVLKGFRVFKGTECDILPDGRLDYDDALLKTFDYVVASVHTHFNQTEAEMTKRICKALSHPAVTMLGHPTGRLLLRRDGYKVDLEAVLQAAARHGKMIEINAQPLRLDLDWVHCKRARELGIPLVINPDAHSTDELALLRFGVYVAQRGWLEKKDVFNTLTPAPARAVQPRHRTSRRPLLPVTRQGSSVPTPGPAPTGRGPDSGTSGRAPGPLIAALVREARSWLRLSCSRTHWIISSGARPQQLLTGGGISGWLRGSA
jgi:DNA polymerase (family 10)